MLNDYICSVYKDGGRGELVSGQRAFDCWGLARAVRSELYGLPSLASWGNVNPADKRQVTQAWQAQCSSFEPCEPEIGALAEVYRGDLCLHLGVVVEADGALAVLETTKRTGPRWMRISDFEREYQRVGYYRDKS